MNKFSTNTSRDFDKKRNYALFAQEMECDNESWQQETNFFKKIKTFESKSDERVYILPFKSQSDLCQFTTTPRDQSTCDSMQIESCDEHQDQISEKPTSTPKNFLLLFTLFLMSTEGTLIPRS